ncbi:hypothetical protein DPMN_031445 [Dreissena polymorpha]|uniref:Uncharacterized protein n=1 Tax=Dreissena polymorpha TaxID=45954 RepID=A0A9D4M349_DREPO|nr:hypothetical protein DPMN_031445 [Dreissena polymorpha]
MHAKEDNQEIPRNRRYHETSSAGLIAESAAPDKNLQSAQTGIELRLPHVP